MEEEEGKYFPYAEEMMCRVHIQLWLELHPTKKAPLLLYETI
jgi:hypothetical protein